MRRGLLPGGVLARINIEDSLFKDRRWLKLLLKTGCEYKALGIVTSAWILAQSHWLKHKSIPKKAWSKDFDVLIECELADLLSDGSVYIKGSEKAFAWLNQASLAGKKSASARSNKTANEVNGGSTGVEAPDKVSQPLTPTLSLTLTHNSNSNTNTNNPPRPKRSPAVKVILIFSEFLEKIPPEVQDNWMELYDSDFLNREILDMKTWAVTNPEKSRRTIRGWVAFCSGWFKRNWDKYQKQLPSKKQNNTMGVKSL